MRVSKQSEILREDVFEFIQLLVAECFYGLPPQGRSRFRKYRRTEQSTRQAAFVQYVQQIVDVLVQRFKFFDEIVFHGTRVAKIDDGSPVNVQQFPPVFPLVDYEIDELGKSDVVTLLQRKRAGFFAIFANNC